MSLTNSLHFHASNLCAITTKVNIKKHLFNITCSLSCDGKSIGDGKCGMIITKCRHEDGRPVAMIPANGKKEYSEASEARPCLPHRR
jgi:hypothetical protein